MTLGSSIKMKIVWWMMMTVDDLPLPLVAVRALRHDEPGGGRHHGDGLQLHPAASVGGQRGRRAGLALDRQLPHSGEPLWRLLGGGFKKVFTAGEP